MPKLRVAVDHSATIVEAKLRVDRFLSTLQREGTISQLHHRWGTDRGDFNCTVAGVPVRGALFLYPDMLILLVDLPAGSFGMVSQLEAMLKRRAEAAMQ
jgi:hypothetical protein